MSDFSEEFKIMRDIIDNKKAQLTAYTYSRSCIVAKFQDQELVPFMESVEKILLTLSEQTILYSDKSKTDQITFVSDNNDDTKKDIPISDHDAQIQKIVSWCKEKALDHFAFYVIDVVKNNCHYYNDDGAGNGIINLQSVYTPELYVTNAMYGKAPDTLYVSDNIIVYSIGAGLDRYGRQLFLRSINHMLETGECREF